MRTTSIGSTGDESTDPTDYPYTHTVRVRFAETDAMGIVHHSRYLPYLEEARVAYLRHLGHPYPALRVVDLQLAQAQGAAARRRGREGRPLHAAQQHVHAGRQLPLDFVRQRPVRPGGVGQCVRVGDVSDRVQLQAVGGQKPTTREWFATAKNYALYSNQGGVYDDILAYLKIR